MDRDNELQPIIERARAFDPDAWEALYRRLYPRLRAYAGRRLAGPACDDAVSEAFTRAMDTVERYSSRAGSFDGWMFGILRNVVLEHYRSRAPVRHDTVPEPESAEQGPLDHLVAGEQAAQVRRAFDRLEPGDRELLELRVLGELDAKQVGAVLGKRAGAVRMAQTRALSRLATELSELREEVPR